MTALLKKDLYLVGKLTWILMASALVFSLIPQFSSFGSAYLMVLMLTLPLTALAYDERCHWDTYLSMTPCPPERVVLGKYLFAFLIGAASTAVTLLSDLGRTALGAADLDLVGSVIEKLSLLVVILTVNAITLPTIFRFGVEKGRLSMLVLMFGIFAVIVGGARFIGEDRMFGWMARVPLPVLGAVGAAVVVIINVMSFFLSVRFYKKRRSGCYR